MYRDKAPFFLLYTINLRNEFSCQAVASINLAFFLSCDTCATQVGLRYSYLQKADLPASNSRVLLIVKTMLISQLRNYCSRSLFFCSFLISSTIRKLQNGFYLVSQRNLPIYQCHSRDIVKLNFLNDVYPLTYRAFFFSQIRSHIKLKKTMPQSYGVARQTYVSFIARTAIFESN